ncbi:MAG: ABC transporter substrate-binding protein [Rhodocyclaceae bacterium]
MMLSRSLSVLVLAFAALGFPGLAQAQGVIEKPQIHIAVGGKAAFYYLPLTIAEQLGYFRDEGLEVKISDFAGGSAALRAVVGGSADVVSGAYEHTINLQSKKQIFQAFVEMGRAPQISVGVSKARAAGFRSYKDLKGMKIGVSAPGSSTNMVVNLIAAKGGLKPGDYSIVGVGTGAGAVAAMKSGQIDAISNVDPVMTMLEQEGAVKVIADARTLRGTQEVFGGPMPAAVLYAPIEFVKKNPNTVQALANAIVRADRWLQAAAPRDILKTVPEAYLLGNQALYLFSYAKVKEALSPDGYISDAGTKTALKALSSFNPAVKASEIKLELTYTNEFVKKAHLKYK